MVGLEDVKFTKTQQAMMDVLADGEPHKRKEMLACLPDSLGSWETVKVHLACIRHKIRPRGFEILCQCMNRTLFYRLVALVPAPAATAAPTATKVPVL